MHAFNDCPTDFESIKPCTGGPKDTHTFMVCILDSKEEAKLVVAANRSEVSVFLDGSGHEGGIGAVAVLYRGGEEKCSLRKFLGSKERHTVFEAEFLSLLLAVEMVKDERQVWSLTISIDSQAAMHTTGNRRAILGQHLVEAFHEQVTAVQSKHPGIEMRMRWMPGHEGIPGNERADEEAKRVAKGESSEQCRLPMVCSGELPVSRLAACQSHRKRISVKTEEQFKLSPRCQRLWLIDPSMPSLRFRRDTQGLEHWKVALLIQLRTGHVQLQEQLCRIDKVEFLVCLMCHKADETVSHYLTTCAAFATQRGHMERHLQRASKSVSTLLMNPKAFPCLFR